MPKKLDSVPKNPLVMISVNEPRQFVMAPGVVKFGRTIAEAHGRYQFTMRNELEFCFRLKSSETFAEDKLDGQIWRNRFPHLFIKRSGVSHFYETKAERTAVFLIYKPETSRIFQAAGIPLDPPCREFEMTPEISSLLEDFRTCEQMVHVPGAADRIDWLGFRLISAVFAQSWNAAVIPSQDEAIHKIASHFESQPLESYNFDELAAQYGLSRRSFFRRWRELYPVSPAEFLHAKRMELVERILMKCDLPIAQLAETMGFSSCGYFIQSFKRYFGISPAGYRRKNSDRQK